MTGQTTDQDRQELERLAVEYAAVDGKLDELTAQRKAANDAHRASMADLLDNIKQAETVRDALRRRILDIAAATGETHPIPAVRIGISETTVITDPAAVLQWAVDHRMTHLLALCESAVKQFLEDNALALAVMGLPEPEYHATPRLFMLSEPLAELVAQHRQTAADAENQA